MDPIKKEPSNIPLVTIEIRIPQLSSLNLKSSMEFPDVAHYDHKNYACSMPQTASMDLSENNFSSDEEFSSTNAVQSPDEENSVSSFDIGIKNEDYSIASICDECDNLDEEFKSLESSKFSVINENIEEMDVDSAHGKLKNLKSVDASQRHNKEFNDVITDPEILQTQFVVDKEVGNQNSEIPVIDLSLDENIEQPDNNREMTENEEFNAERCREKQTAEVNNNVVKIDKNFQNKNLISEEHITIQLFDDVDTTSNVNRDDDIIIDKVITLSDRKSCNQIVQKGTSVSKILPNKNFQVARKNIERTVVYNVEILKILKSTDFQAGKFNSNLNNLSIPIDGVIHSSSSNITFIYGYNHPFVHIMIFVKREENFLKNGEAIMDRMFPLKKFENDVFKFLFSKQTLDTHETWQCIIGFKHDAVGRAVASSKTLAKAAAIAAFLKALQSFCFTIVGIQDQFKITKILNRLKSKFMQPDTSSASRIRRKIKQNVTNMSKSKIEKILNSYAASSYYEDYDLLFPQNNSMKNHLKFIQQRATALFLNPYYYKENDQTYLFVSKSENPHLKIISELVNESKDNGEYEYLIIKPTPVS